MPVDDIPVHEKVRIDAGKPYGCSNHVKIAGYFAPDRSYAGQTYENRIVFITDAMSKECRHDKALTDPRCQECRHRLTGRAAQREKVSQ